MGEKEGWEKCMNINLSGVLNGINVVASNCCKEREVTILNVASILGLFNAQQPKGWAYNTSKSAVVTATRCMATAWPNVRMVHILYSLESRFQYLFVAVPVSVGDPHSDTQRLYGGRSEANGQASGGLDERSGGGPRFPNASGRRPIGGRDGLVEGLPALFHSR